MSSTQKGNAFETQVLTALQSELSGGRLIVNPKTAVLTPKKAYPSRDRGSNITVDIALEAFLPSQPKPSVIWVFECKDYDGSIPVNDLEEFHAKLEQIGQDNTKGTFVTSAALQRGALEYAKSKGIGVIRLLPSSQIQHILALMTPSNFRGDIDWTEFPRALTTPTHRSERSFFANFGNYHFANLCSLLNYGLEESRNAKHCAQDGHQKDPSKKT